MSAKNQRSGGSVHPLPSVPQMQPSDGAADRTGMITARGGLVKVKPVGRLPAVFTFGQRDAQPMALVGTSSCLLLRARGKICRPCLAQAHLMLKVNTLENRAAYRMLSGKPPRQKSLDIEVGFWYGHALFSCCG